MENTHITEEQLTDFYHDRLKPDTLTAFLNHLSQCEYCAGRMAACFPGRQLLILPEAAKESIAAGRRRRKSPLFSYSIRVCGAAASALAVLVITVFLGVPLLQSSTADYSAYVAERETLLQKETDAWRSRSADNTKENWVGQIGSQLNRLLSDSKDSRNYKNGGNQL